MTLNRSQLKERIQEDELISNFIDLETQLQPAGFDVTVSEIHKFKDSGKLDFSNGEREIPETEKVETVKKDDGDDFGRYRLEEGSYKVVMNEEVDIPENLTGYAFPRSSLLRMGCTVDNAVWDAGYTGTGSFLLIVENDEGVEIKENARVNQLVFERIDSTEGYSGQYHEE